MEARPSEGKFTIGLLVVICLVALVLAIWQHHAPAASITAPASSIPPTSQQQTQTPSPSDVHANWRTDVTHVLAEYDQNQDARAAEQGLLALHVTDADRTLHLQLVLAFHALGESRPEGKTSLAAARRLFASVQP